MGPQATAPHDAARVATHHPLPASATRHPLPASATHHPLTVRHTTLSLCDTPPSHSATPPHKVGQQHVHAAARVRVGRQAIAAQRGSDGLDAELLEALAGLHRVVPQESFLDVPHRAPKGSGEGVVDGVLHFGDIAYATGYLSHCC